MPRGRVEQGEDAPTLGKPTRKPVTARGRLSGTDAPRLDVSTGGVDSQKPSTLEGTLTLSQAARGALDLTTKDARTASPAPRCPRRTASWARTSSSSA